MNALVGHARLALRTRYSKLVVWTCVAVFAAATHPSGVVHAQYAWQTKAPLLDPRTGSGVEGASASLIGGKIYVSHGYRFSDSSLLSIYDSVGDSWTHGGLSAPDAVVPRSEMGGGTAFGKHYAVGGRTGPTAAVEEFDPAGPTWTTMTSLPFPRGGLGCASFGNKIYSIGGRGGATFGGGPIYGDNDVFDPTAGVGGTWSPLAPLPIPVSDNYASVGYLGKIYVFGGVDSLGAVITKTQIYDIASNTWSAGTDMPTPRGDAMAGVLCPQSPDARIAVFGGYNGFTNLTVTELYDPASDTWAAGPPMPNPVSEVAQGMTWDATGVYSIGTGIFGPSGTDLYRLVRTTPCIGGCFTLDFETDDEGQSLVHGQHLGNGDPEFNGGASFPVTITSSVNASNLPTAAVLDSDTGPAAQDPDLLVGRGNILILQTDANTSECPPASGIYCSHNDDEDGGTLSFSFPGPITPASVVLIDIDSSDGTSTVVLTDGAGAQRTYSVPANWTGDFISDGPPGWKLLDLTDTNGQIGFGSTATAVDDMGFDPTGVLQIDINLAGSGAVDDLSWCETSVAVQPSVQPRNGSGVNHVILSNTSLPQIGGTWAANLDCRGFGSGLATLSLCRRATSGTMTPHGEQLIAGAFFLRSAQVFAGSVSQFNWTIPNDPALLGLDLHAQGDCWSTQVPLGPKTMQARRGLSNALDLILGF